MFLIKVKTFFLVILIAGISLTFPQHIQALTECQIVYSVKEGDSLTKIVELTDSSDNPLELAKLNKIDDPNLIVPDQKIVIDNCTKPDEKAEVLGVTSYDDNIWIDGMTAIAFAFGVLLTGFVSIIFHLYNNVSKPIVQLRTKVDMLEKIILTNSKNDKIN